MDSKCFKTSHAVTFYCPGVLSYRRYIFPSAITKPMCSVFSAISGEALAVVEHEGKSGKEVKQSLALVPAVGVPRFRQRIFSEDGAREIQDDEVFSSEPVRISLMVLELQRPQRETQYGMDKYGIMAAIRRNDLEALELLLQVPLDPNLIRTFGRTPMHHATGAGHVESMQLLIEAGAAKNARESTAAGCTPILLAVKRGHVEGLRLLIAAEADLNRGTRDTGATPLLLASEAGQVEIVRLLIDAEVDIDKATTHTGATPLLLAAGAGKIEVVRLLIAARADLNKTRSVDETSPLVAAAEGQRIEVVRLLVESMADLTQATTCLGGSPLMVAMRREAKPELTK